MRSFNVRRSVALAAAAAAVAVAGLSAAACSSGSNEASPARAAAEASSAAASAQSVPSDGSNVRPDVVDLDIMQADNGKTLQMVVGQLANFPDLPEGNYEVTSTDNDVVQGIMQESLQLGAVKEGKASIVISDFDSGDPILQFDVEVVPAG